MIQVGYILLIVHTNYHSISMLFFELYTCYTVLLIMFLANNRNVHINKITNLMSTAQSFIFIAILYSIAGIPYAALFGVKVDILLHVPIATLTIALLITTLPTGTVSTMVLSFFLWFIYHLILGNLFIGRNP